MAFTVEICGFTTVQILQFTILISTVLAVTMRMDM